MRAGGLPWVMLSVIALGTVGAVPADGTFTFHPPAEIHGGDGGFFLNLTDGSYVAGYAAAHPTAGSVQLTTTSAEITIIERVMTRYVLPDGTIIDPPAGNEERDETRHSTGAANMTIGEWDAYHTIVIALDEGLTARAPAATVTESIAQPVLISDEPSARTPQPFENFTYWPNAIDYAPPGTYHEVRVPSLDARDDGTIFLYAMGATFHVTNETGNHVIRTGSAFESRANLVGEGAVVRYRTTAAVLQATGSVLLNYSSPTLFTFSKGLDMHGVSNVSLPLAAGTLRTGSGPFEFRDRPHLDLAGDMVLHFPPVSESDDGRLTVQVGGDVVAVSQNRLGTTTFDADALTAVAGGISFVVLAAAILSFMRRAAILKWVESWKLKVWFLAPFAARIEPDDVLANEKRRAIYELLTTRLAYARIGQVRAEAAAALDIGSWGVYYHLQKMNAAGVIKLRRAEGRSTICVEPNHGFAGTTERKAAAAVTNQPLPKLVARVVVEQRWMNQKEISARVNEALAQGAISGRRRVSHVAVHKWLKKMEAYPLEATPARMRGSRGEENGRRDTVRLLESRRAGRSIQYRARQALADVVMARYESPERFIAELRRTPQGEA